MASAAQAPLLRPLAGARGGWALAFGWRRLAVTLAVSAALTGLHGLVWESPFLSLMWRVFGVGLLAMAAFSLFEQWPRRLPRWLPRWVLQVVMVGLSVPLSLTLVYLASTEAAAPPFWQVEKRLGGFALLTASGVLIAPWIALGALVRQREAFAREQALAFQLERSELERQATNAQLRLLQAQVQPHFIFNTLANVRALVNAGSPRASEVLGHLIDYLRAAVPRLHEPTSTLGQEVQLVSAYLELMRMRMPDRMRFVLEVDEAAAALPCPPMTLMTLVENAVRHGVDPAEEGGQIHVRVRLAEGRCHIAVRDSGVGLTRSGDSLGTGLAGLRERLRLAFGAEAHLRISEVAPHGVLAEVEFPARRAEDRP